MSQEKKIIERNLKFDQHYFYLGLQRGTLEGGNATSCDNCGVLITNHCYVQNEKTGEKFTIGTDCCETLQRAKVLYKKGWNGPDFSVDMYSLNKTNRFMTQARKPENYGHIEFAGMELKLDYYDNKGAFKTVWAAPSDIKDYYPSFYEDIKHLIVY